MESKPRKVLLVNTSDSGGGAANSTRRIMSFLLKAGFDCRLLVGRKKGEKSNRIFRASSNLGMYFWYLLLKLESLLGYQGRIGPASLRSLGSWYDDCKVVILFNFHGYYISLNILKSLVNRTVFIRLSDMWWFTGHCAYSGDCFKYEKDCHPCPSLDLYPAIGRDLAEQNWELKRDLVAMLKPEILCPSNWMLSCATRSTVLGPCKKHLLPNSVDEALFYPLDVPQKYDCILVADRFLGNPRKGFAQAIEVFGKLSNLSSLRVVVVSHDEMIPSHTHSHLLNLQLEFVGPAYGARLASLYRESRLLLCCSLEDNLPNVVLESLACGTPVLGFDIGGMSDAVIEGVSGYLVPLEHCDSLADRLDDILSLGEVQMRDFRKSAHEIAQSKFGANLERDTVVRLIESALI